MLKSEVTPRSSALPLRLRLNHQSCSSQGYQLEGEHVNEHPTFLTPGPCPQRAKDEGPLSVMSVPSCARLCHCGSFKGSKKTEPRGLWGHQGKAIAGTVVIGEPSHHVPQRPLQSSSPVNGAHG